MSGPSGPSGPTGPDDGSTNPPNFPPYIDETSLHWGKYGRVLILDAVFRLLSTMIGSLQSVAAAQASRLSFLTQWQKAYTDSMNQVHTFIKSNGDAIGGGGSAEGAARDDLNRVNSTYTEQLRNRRSVIADDAKALQSNVNQSNDSVNQQSQLATALIQEMSTILGAIFR